MAEMKVTPSERFFALAELNIGEALVEISNQRLRGATIGQDMTVARDKLRRAIAALEGKVWTAPVDPQHEKPANKDAEGK